MLSGIIGNDAVVREGGNTGDRAIGFSVAHSEKYKDAQGVQHERTTWVSCTIWRKSDRLAIVPHLKKGTKVFVSGLPSVDMYTNNQGHNVANLRLNVMTIELLGNPNNQQPQHNNSAQQPFNTQSQAAVAPSNHNPITDTTDDLPF